MHLACSQGTATPKKLHDEFAFAGSTVFTLFYFSQGVEDGDISKCFMVGLYNRRQYVLFNELHGVTVPAALTE